MNLKAKLTALLFVVCLLSFAQKKANPQLGIDPIDDVVAAMTLDEKISMVRGTGMDVPSFNGQVTGNIAGKVAGAAGSTFEIPRLGIPSIIFADGPAGLRIDTIRVNDSKRYYTTAFPIGTSLASSWNTELLDRVGEAVGNEILEYGVDIWLAPAFNIQRNPLCGRNFEYYSEDPFLSGKLATAIINGVQSKGVGTSIKHYAVNNQETNRNNVDAIISERALREIYLKGFEIAVKEANPWTIMSAYNKVNGTYASESYDLLTTIPRDEWGFTGIVITDWYAGKDYSGQVKAGNDLLMPGRTPENKKIRAAIENGILSETELDRNIIRILNTILKTPSCKNYKYSNNPELKKNADIAREAAAEGIVMLKNEGHSLPLKSNKIALLGNPSYDMFIGGNGSGEVYKAYVISLLEGLTKAGYEVDKNLVKKYQNHIKEEKLKQPERTNILQKYELLPEIAWSQEDLAKIAQTTDIAILTIGRNAGESADRKVEKDYYLSASELELIKNTAAVFHAQKKKIVVVLNIDAVIDVSKWQNDVDAIIVAWLPGQEAGNAIADVLSGKINPSGRLSATFPMDYNDVPSAETFPKPGERPKTSIYNEGIYVGYRYYNTFDIKPAYEFGYGLSYTTFNYSDLKLSSNEFNEKIEISLTITNTGNTAGKEVVQLYISAPTDSLDKPNEELKGFFKTKLLQPGEKQQVSFIIDASNLASFNTQCSAWIADKGRYIVKIGASSKDFRLSKEFSLKNEIIVEKVHKVLAPEIEFKEITRISKGKDIGIN